METAKVDIRKLQMLNDRIHQTIDALNQVRMSVHGLQHTTPTAGLAGGPFTTTPTPGWQPTPTPFGGLSHTTGAYGTPYGTTPVQALQALQMLQQQMMQIQQQLQQQMGTPFVPPTYAGMGIGHTSGIDEVTMHAMRAQQDPYAAMRYAQSFPFALQPFAPFTTY